MVFSNGSYVIRCLLCLLCYDVNFFFTTFCLQYTSYRSTIGHKKDIIDKNEKNAFAKHLINFHPDKVGDTAAFKLKVESTHKKCLERQVSEGIHIVNSKSEYLQPAVRRVITTREVRSNGS